MNILFYILESRPGFKRKDIRLNLQFHTKIPSKFPTYPGHFQNYFFHINLALIIINTTEKEWAVFNCKSKHQLFVIKNPITNLITKLPIAQQITYLSQNLQNIII